MENMFGIISGTPLYIYCLKCVSVSGSLEHINCSKFEFELAGVQCTISSLISLCMLAGLQCPLYCSKFEYVCRTSVGIYCCFNLRIDNGGLQYKCNWFCVVSDILAMNHYIWTYYISN